MDFITNTRVTDHPLENVFDISPNSTVVITESVKSPAVQSRPVDDPEQIFDEHDKSIDSMFQEVYESAMTSFADQAGLLLQSDPKNNARNMEVANAFLGTALAAAKEKAALKLGKEKVKKHNGPSTVNNNLIMDRNELLKMLQKKGLDN